MINVVLGLSVFVCIILSTIFLRILCHFLCWLPMWRIKISLYINEICILHLFVDFDLGRLRAVGVPYLTRPHHGETGPKSEMTTTTTMMMMKIYEKE